MKIVFIGAGNLATNLCHALKFAGHDIIQVYSRTIESAQVLTNLCGGVPVNDIKLIANDADLYVVALKDSVLSELLPDICNGRSDKIFVHTAGSVTMDIFKGLTDNYGVVYPLQTFSKSRILAFDDIPCFIEANNPATEKTLQTLAESICKNVRIISSEQRKHIHLAAVFASNFSNHCYALAADILERNSLSFNCLLPLIKETANKVEYMHPAKAQTGPAVRFDENIISKQSALLDYNQDMRRVYDLMSLNIHKKSSSL